MNWGVPGKKSGILPSEIMNSKKIIVGLSGGKDSTYGLMYLSQILKNEIIAFTYEWPMVNQIARQNASRVVKLLGIEHVVRAPNTFKQLRFIRRIVYAISKSPDSRAIPLLLAPDKFFFSHAIKVASKYKADAIVFCSGNELEYTDFKSLLLGATSSNPQEMLRVSKFSIFYMVIASFSMYLKNPRLILAGLYIPFITFFQTYVRKRKIINLFNYIDWDEKIINEKLTNIWYNDVGAPSDIDWRAGDGSADFYNYLYRSLLGFDERTCNLSNRVRAGLMNRSVALEIDKNFSEPNYNKLDKYASKVGFNLDEFILNWNARK
jgi:glucosamine--fructose-6-phosphate aminotransferase (isomerizing)